jgi:hypothetical protein
MAYDANKDRKVAVLAEAFAPDGANMELAVWQYNGGAKKVRLTVTRRGYVSAALKLNKPEWEWLLQYQKIIDEALR